MTTAPVTTPRRRLRAALVAGALGSTLLGGCAVFSPMQTDHGYQAADGVNKTFGDLDVRGIVVVSDAKDASGKIVGQLVNTSAEDLEVAFATATGAAGQVTVPRYGSLALGDDKALTIEKVDASPGDVLQVSVETRATGQNIVEVPVLPSFEYYESHRAPGSTPSETPSATPSPSASASH